VSENEKHSEASSSVVNIDDDDPPRESERLAEFEEIHEPADDDPPTEPRSPWFEVPVDDEQVERTRAAPDDDPPPEPRSVESIPHVLLDEE
jgi:hypothetical protein